MRNLIMAGLMATSLLPAAAQAQWYDRGEHAQYRGDHRDWDRHDDRRDWRGDRDGYWNGGRRYGFYQPRYQGYGYNRDRLPPARWGQRWVRHHRDALLIDVRDGDIIHVIRNFYW